MTPFKSIPAVSTSGDSAPSQPLHSSIEVYTWNRSFEVGPGNTAESGSPIPTPPPTSLPMPSLKLLPKKKFQIANRSGERVLNSGSQQQQRFRDGSFLNNSNPQYGRLGVGTPSSNEPQRLGDAILTLSNQEAHCQRSRERFSKPKTSKYGNTMQLEGSMSVKELGRSSPSVDRQALLPRPDLGDLVRSTHVVQHSEDPPRGKVDPIRSLAAEAAKAPSDVHSPASVRTFQRYQQKQVASNSHGDRRLAGQGQNYQTKQVYQPKQLDSSNQGEGLAGDKLLNQLRQTVADSNKAQVFERQVDASSNASKRLPVQEQPYQPDKVVVLSNKDKKDRVLPVQGQSGSHVAEQAVLSSGGPFPATQPPTLTSPIVAFPSQQTQPAYRFKYPEYLDPGVVSQGIKSGHLFKATLRVNAFKRSEGYVTIEGVPVDVLLDGMVAQNRAIEGDVVVVQVNPVSAWTKLRGCKVEESKEDEVLEGLDLGVTASGPLNELEKLQDERVVTAESSRQAPFPADISSLTLEDSNPEAAFRRAVHFLASQVKSNPTKRPTGFIVAVLEPSPRRESIVGYLDVPSVPLVNGNSSPTVQLTPADPRLPKMVAFVDGLPDGLKERVRAGDSTVAQTLVAARLHNWKSNCHLPQAVVRQSLGQAGEIETETAAIIFEHKVQGPDFPDSVLRCLPPTPWSIPTDELERRKDLRNYRVVSIDPPTARDLDDALSVRRLPNGNVEVGVHIADVSYFVRPGTPLDKEARFRSTSVYLVQKVIPMLPRLLCEELCSLNPGVDRLAFSVIWELTEEGFIVDQWMGRSVIRTCCKLAYGHAQAMIDNVFHPEGAIDGSTLQGANRLVTLHGSFSWADVIADISTLHSLAMKMRSRRFDNGALKLENQKLFFALDEDGNPKDALTSERAEANQLIEEFMLLANQSVARTISRALPERALLRRHPPPNARKLEDVAELCAKQGLAMDLTSSGSIHQSLSQLAQLADPAVCEILHLAVTKPMQLAQYFCTGGELREEAAQWAHYGLAMPLYTHFTSPIRRYPDVLVHRMLAAALDAESHLANTKLYGKQAGASLRPFTGPPSLEEQASGSVEELLRPPLENVAKAEKKQAEVVSRTAKKHCLPTTNVLCEWAEHCNERKLASRHAQEASDKLFLCVLLKRAGLIASEARVVNTGPKFLTLYVLRFGIERRVYFEDMKGLRTDFFEETGTVIIEEDPSQQKPAGRRKRGGKSKVGANGRVNGQKNEKGVLRQDSLGEEEDEGFVNTEGLEPAVLPLTLKAFSRVPVVCSVLCPPRQPMDIIARLWISGSYEADS